MPAIPTPNTIQAGLIEAIEAAGIVLKRRPDGWHVSDAIAAQAIIDGYDGSAEQLAFLKDRKREELAATFTGKIEAGRVFNGVTFQIDAGSQANIAAMATRAGLVLANAPGSEAWPQGFYWIAADNSHVPMDAAAMYAFAQDVGGYVSLLIMTNRAYKDAIGAAQDVAALNSIDVGAGWPG